MIFLSKQTVQYYIRRDSSGFMYFLDTKKSFHKVRHRTLFKKFIEMTAPYIVGLHVFWYREQETLVRWSSLNSVSDHCISVIRR